MAEVVTMPRLSDTMTVGTVAKWHAAVGDQINEGDFSYFLPGYTQEVVNRRVTENVQHLEIILAYAPTDETDATPDVVGSSADKTPYTDAIATGKAYLEANG